MVKRSNKKIEQDLSCIKEAAKTARTLKELADLTGLTMQQVRTSLSRHPIVHKRIIATLEGNRNKVFELEEPICSKVEPVSVSVSVSSLSEEDDDDKWVVICDAPALVYGLQACTGTPVVIPQFVVSSLEGLASSTDYEGDPMPEALKASRSLSMIFSSDWATIAPRLKEETLLVDPEEKCSWRAKALVSLACKYWVDGYHVTIKTRTGEISSLAKLQGCITVEFVPNDAEIKLAKIS